MRSRRAISGAELGGRFEVRRGRKLLHLRSRIRQLPTRPAVPAPVNSKEERNMKPRTWMWMPVVSLFAVLAMPVGMAAQDNPSQDHKPKHQKYKLIDLGTFGGPNSFVNGPTVPIMGNNG